MASDGKRGRGRPKGSLNKPKGWLNKKRKAPVVRPKPNTSGLRPWQKGQSGNPGGRPSKLPISDALRLLLGEQGIPKAIHPEMTNAERMAMRLIRKAMKETDFKALVEIMDRVEGKARQRIEASGPGGGPIPFELPGTREEIERRIAELLEKRKANSN
jgi:hypothetical protein